MPIEIVQRHIGIIADLRELIGHDVPGQYLDIAPFLHYHIRIDTFIEHLEAYQVIRHLECGIEHLTVRPVVFRAGGLLDGISVQRERFAGGYAVFGDDHVHHFQLVVVNGKLGSIQEGPCFVLGNGVIVRCLFDDLDLSPHRAVLHGNLSGFPGLQLNSANGGVDYIAITLDLLQFVLAFRQFPRELDDTILIGHILAKQIVFGVIEVEHRPINGFLCLHVDLNEPQGGKWLIEQFHCTGLTPGQGNLMDCFIQLVSRQGLHLLQIKGFASIHTREQDLSQAIGTVGSHLPVELVIDPDLYSLHRLFGIRVQLYNFKCRPGLVAPFHDVQLSGFQFHGSGGRIRLVSIRRLNLSYPYPDLLLIGDVDDTCVISVKGSNGPAIDLLDIESYIGDGFACDVIHLADLQPGAGLIDKLHHGGGSVLQLHQFCFACGDIGRVGPHLSHQVPARDNILSSDHCHAVFAGCNLSHHPSVRMTHLKNGVRDRLTGDSILLGDDQRILRGVFQLQNRIFGSIQLDLMDSFIQEVPGQRSFFFYFINLTGFQGFNDDLSA